MVYSEVIVHERRQNVPFYTQKATTGNLRADGGIEGLIHRDSATFTTPGGGLACASLWPFEVDWIAMGLCLLSDPARHGADAGEPMDLAEDGFETFVDIGCLESRGLEKAEAKLCGCGGALLDGYLPFIGKVALVANQHDDDFVVGVVLELLKPAADGLEGVLLCDVVYQEGTDSTTVIGGGNGAVALLTRGIPDLCFDDLVCDTDGASGEFNADGGLGV